MSIPEETLFNSYDPNGVITLFTFGFTLFRAEDLLVELDGVEVTSGFTISGVGTPGGGSIAFDTAPDGTALVLKLRPTFDRQNDYQEAGDLLADTLNKDVDRLWQALQYVLQNNNIAIKLPFETAANQQITATAAQRVLKMIGFDASGNLALLSQADLSVATVTALAASLLSASTAGAMQTVLGVSAFVKTLLDDADAAAVLTTLGIPAYIKTLLDDTTAAEARATLGIVASNVRQTVQYGPYASAISDIPAALASSSASLSLSGSGSASLIVTAANGFGVGADRIGYAAAMSSLTWSGLTANSTCYLYVEVAADGTLTTGFTTTQPVYRYSYVADGLSVALNAHSFDITRMIMYCGNGSTVSQVWRVFIGECVTGASTVTSSVTYAYNGVSVQPWVANIPAVNSSISHTHNLGIQEGVTSKLELYCVTADKSFSQYDIASEVFGFSTYAYPLQVRRTAKSSMARTGSVTAMMLVDQSTGAAVTPTAASWKYRFNTRRNW